MGWKIWRWLFGCSHEKLCYLFYATARSGSWINVYECEDCGERIYKEQIPVTTYE